MQGPWKGKRAWLLRTPVRSRPSWIVKSGARDVEPKSAEDTELAEQAGEQQPVREEVYT